MPPRRHEFGARQTPVEAIQDGRIYIQLINGAFFEVGGTPDQYRAALARAITLGSLAARIRNLCEVHRRWCGPVRVVTICRKSASTPATLQSSNDEHWNPPPDAGINVRPRCA